MKMSNTKVSKSTAINDSELYEHYNYIPTGLHGAQLSNGYFASIRDRLLLMERTYNTSIYLDPVNHQYIISIP